MTDLLPCPFCGGEANTVLKGSDDWHIECHDCASRSGIYGIKESAIAAWNTRVDVEHGGIPMTEENMAKHGWVRERTCTVISVNYDELMDEVYTQFSCGHEGCGGMSWFNYCPTCGARVKGES